MAILHDIEQYVAMLYSSYSHMVDLCYIPVMHNQSHKPIHMRINPALLTVLHSSHSDNSDSYINKVHWTNIDISYGLRGKEMYRTCSKQISFA